MRKPFIAGNWKLNKTINEAVDLLTILKRELTDFTTADIAVCPPFTALSDASELLIESPIKLGAQNVYWQESGAFTGEVSCTLLKDAGCTYVILGHSERRQFFYETDETVNKKIKVVLTAGLTPIVCVGEVLKERENGTTIAVIEKQLSGGFAGITHEQMGQVIIAYEPVWAIGTGKTATPDQAQEVHHFIRGWVAKNYSSEIADSVRILYGGSVKPANVKELMGQTDIDGSLVGGASLDAQNFTAIVKGSV